MRIAVHNNKSYSAPKAKARPLPDPKNVAKDFLALRGRSLPPFQVSKEKEYNGMVVYVDDDAAEEFVEELETAGFGCETE